MYHYLTCTCIDIHFGIVKCLRCLVNARPRSGHAMDPIPSQSLEDLSCQICAPRHLNPSACGIFTSSELSLYQF